MLSFSLICFHSLSASKLASSSLADAIAFVVDLGLGAGVPTHDVSLMRKMEGDHGPSMNAFFTIVCTYNLEESALSTQPYFLWQLAYHQYN